MFSRSLCAPLLGVFIILSAAGTSEATAALVSLQVTGIVDQVVDDSNLLSQPITVGMPFVGLLVYDTDVADLSPDVTKVGEYDQPVGSFSIDVGGNHFDTVLGANFRFQVRIDSAFPPGSGDIVSLDAVGQTALTNLDELSIGMTLQDWSSAALTSDALPSSFDASLFNNRWIQIRGSDYRPVEVGSQSFQVHLRPDSFTSVPEPSTLALAGLGGLGLLAYRMRFRKARRDPGSF